MKNKNFKKKYEFKGLGVIRFLEKTRNWELDAGLKFSPTKKHREYFQTLELAKARANQLLIKLKNEGLNGFKLSPSEQLDASNAIKIINGLNVNLTQVAQFYATHATQKGSRMTISELIDDFFDRKCLDVENGEGVRPRTLGDYKSKNDRLRKEIGEIKVSEFSHIDHWEPLSKKLGRSSRRFENHLRTLLKFAVERGYIKSSPMIGKLKPAPPQKQPVVFTEVEWRRLIITALETEQEFGLLAYVLLTTVMGIRPESETRNLHWSDIDLVNKQIFIADDQTGKNFLGRNLLIPEFAIDLFSYCKVKEGPIIPTTINFNITWDKLREIAGFLKLGNKRKKVWNKWSHDVARHTAATMHYGMYQSKEKVSDFLGHTNKSTMRYYVKHAKGIGEEAKRFYSFKINDPQNEDIRKSVCKTLKASRGINYK